MFKLKWILFITAIVFFFNCDKKEKENNPITPEPPKFILSDFYGTWLDSSDSIVKIYQYFEPDSFLKKIIDNTKFGGTSWIIGNFNINNGRLNEAAFLADSNGNKTGALDIGLTFDKIEISEDSLRLYKSNGTWLFFNGKLIQTPLR